VVLLSLLGPGQASAAVAELFLDGEDAPIARRGFELIAPAP
jgi:hypothetical protein